MLLLRNVSFRAITSITFSFRYNSSSLRFGLIPWQFENKMFVPIKLIKGYLLKMLSDGLGWWNLLGEVLGCLGTALVVLLGGCFWDGFGNWVNFGARECEGFRGT